MSTSHLIVNAHKLIQIHSIEMFRVLSIQQTFSGPKTFLLRILCITSCIYQKYIDVNFFTRSPNNILLSFSSVLFLLHSFCIFYEVYILRFLTRNPECTVQNKVINNNFVVVVVAFSFIKERLLFSGQREQKQQSIAKRSKVLSFSSILDGSTENMLSRSKRNARFQNEAPSKKESGECLFLNEIA